MKNPKNIKRRIAELQRTILKIKQNRGNLLNVELDALFDMEDLNIDPMKPSRSMENLLSHKRLADEYSEESAAESYPGWKVDENEKL